jgi:hypothetical protein
VFSGHTGGGVANYAALYRGCRPVTDYYLSYREEVGEGFLGIGRKGA